MRLRSAPLENGFFPTKYTHDGENISPPLQWEDVPGTAQELVVVFETNPPQGHVPFVQWLAYKIPAHESGELPEGYKHAAAPERPVPIRQGRNSNNSVGYDGPWGVLERPQRYRFHLYALAEPIDLPSGVDKGELQRAISGHVIAEAEFEALYERRAA